jgi:hypothetical protein
MRNPQGSPRYLRFEICKLKSDTAVLSLLLSRRKSLLRISNVPWALSPPIGPSSYSPVGIILFGILLLPLFLEAGGIPTFDEPEP